MTREALHELVDRIPVPLDDEPVSPGDAEATACARGDVQAGRIIPHDEILREFGSR